MKWKAGVWWEGKARESVPREKPSRAEKRANKANPHIASTPKWNPGHLVGEWMVPPL